MMRRATALTFVSALAVALFVGVSPAHALLAPPTIDGPTGVVPQRPSYTITGIAGATIYWNLCRRVNGQLTGCRPDDFRTELSPANTGPLPAPDGPDGVYILLARQQFLNDSSDPISREFTLQRQIPPAPVVVAPPVVIGTPAYTFAWTAEQVPGGSFAWELHGGGAVSGPLVDSGTTPGFSATTTQPLPEGAYAFRVRQLDIAGTASAWSAPAVVTVDLTAPAAPQIISDPPAATETAPTFVWSGGEPGVVFRWQLLDGAATPVVPATTTDQTQATVPAPLAAGAYAFEVVAVDAAGHVSLPARLGFTLGPSAPPPALPSIEGLVLTPGVGQVGLSWALEASSAVGAVRIMRRAGASPSGPADPAAATLEVAPTAGSFIDMGLTPAVRYFYAVYARGAAGGFSRVAATGSAVPTAPPADAGQQNVPPGAVNPPGPSVLPTTAPPTTTPTTTTPSNRPATVNARLMKPRAGATLRVRRLLLRWTGRPGGTVLFNLQIFDARGKKVHKAFPRTNRYLVPAGVLKSGRRYFWRVWPWFGPVRKFAARPLGVSFFQYRAPRPVAASKASAGR
jgi:hypothetical protein